MENEENKIDRQKTVEQNGQTTEQLNSIEEDDSAQSFLDMRRGIQRMNRRRDAWTRR